MRVHAQNDRISYALWQVSCSSPTRSTSAAEKTTLLPTKLECIRVKVFFAAHGLIQDTVVIEAHALPRTQPRKYQTTIPLSASLQSISGTQRATCNTLLKRHAGIQTRQKHCLSNGPWHTNLDRPLGGLLNNLLVPPPRVGLNLVVSQTCSIVEINGQPNPG